MYIHNKTLRIVGIVAAVILSILLVFSLIAVPLYSVVASVTKPSTLVDIVQEVDVTETLLDDDSVQEALNAMGIDDQGSLMQNIIGSDFIEQTAALYTEQVANVLLGDAADINFTEADVQALANDHMDDLLNIVYEHIPEAEIADREKVEKEFTQLVEQYSSHIVQALPDGEAIQNLVTQSEIAAPLALLVNPTVPVVLYVIIGVLAALVFVCLLHRFGGLLCLGIDTLVAAIPLAILYALLSKNGLIMSMLADSEAGALLTPVLTVLGGKVLTAVIVLAVVGALLIAGYIVYTQLQKNRPATPADEAPVTE